MASSSMLAKKIQEVRESDLNRSFSYHSRVSPKYKCVCMTVPKVACSTIKLILNHLDGEADPDRIGEVHNQGRRLADFSVDENVEMLTSSDWYRFAFVRNPYDRLLSAYKSKIGIWGDGEYAWLQQAIRAEYDYPKHPEGWVATPAFRDFVRYLVSHWDQVGHDGHLNLQSNILAHDLIQYDSVKWFFYFVDEFRRILEQVGAPQGEIDRVAVRNNATLPVHHPLAYDKEIADMVYDLYRDDFDRYGFEKNSWLYGADARHVHSLLSGVIGDLPQFPVKRE